MGLKPMKRDKDIWMIQEHTTVTYDIFDEKFQNWLFQLLACRSNFLF